MTLELPPTLQARLDALPAGLRAHVGRVREIARELGKAHGVDADLSELTAAAHDVARHIPGPRLIEEAERFGVGVSAVERYAPVLLHGPVGAAWLDADGAIDDRDVIEGVRWHTTAHADLAPVGQVVFLADKLDPQKSKMYPFQDAVREAAFRSLPDGILAFLDGALRAYIDRGELLHPTSTDARNALLLAAAC